MAPPEPRREVAAVSLGETIVDHAGGIEGVSRQITERLGEASFSPIQTGLTSDRSLPRRRLLALSTLVMYRFVDVLGYPELAVWVPTTVAVMTMNYLGCKHWAFANEARPGKTA